MSTAPVETTPLLTPMAPECSRAATICNLQQRPPLRQPAQGRPAQRQPAQGQPRRLLRGQRHPLRHRERSSTMKINGGNDGQVRQGISDDQLRAYLDQRAGGGILEAPRLEARPDIQPAQAVPQNCENVQPEQTYMEGNHLIHAQVKPAQMQMPEHMHLKPTASEHQVAADSNRIKQADSNRIKQAQKEEARRLKDVEMHNEASEAGRRMMLNEANQQQVIQAIQFQQSQAAMVKQLQEQQEQQQQQATSAIVIPGSMNGLSEQQRQQQFPAGNAPNLMSGEGSRLVLHYSAVTMHMKIVYASMVNVFDGVPLELANAVCKMLARCSPPSTPHFATQAGPSQAPPMSASSAHIQAPQAGELSQGTKAPLTQFLEKGKERVSNKEEDNVAIMASLHDKAGLSNTIDQPGPSSAPRTMCHEPTHVASPATWPDTKSLTLKRKIAHDHDVDMDCGDLYMRGANEEYVLIRDVDVKPASLTTTTDHVIAKYDAILKEFDV